MLNLIQHLPEVNVRLLFEKSHVKRTRYHSRDSSALVVMKTTRFVGMTFRWGACRKQNAQIDLLIDRNDRAINLCEMKFSEHEFTIDKSYAENIRRKKHEFINIMKLRKNVFVTFVTTFGVKSNQYSDEVMDNQVTIDSLFLAD